MKILLENWRQYLNEEEKPNMGVFVNFEPEYTISLSLANLDFIKQELANSDSADELMQKLESKDLYDKAIVGYIHAGYNPMYSKAAPSMGGSGGNCAGTYSVRESIGKGYGEQLYNALLGFAAKNDVYIASDRHSVSSGAKRRWAKIDAQTDDETPSSGEPYVGTFDNHQDKKTDPIDDDCIVHGIDSLDKGYKDGKQVDFYNQLKDNLDSFFEEEVETMFDEPSFLGKLFGNTPRNKAEKLKKQLLRLGRSKFNDWEIEALKNPELR
jgi:hypothetical protein